MTAMACRQAGSSARTPSAATCGGKTSAKVGKTLTLSSRAHGVSGTATVVDDCTIQLSNFNYDGGGLPDVYVWGAKGGNYNAGFRIGSNLFGTPRSNATGSLRSPYSIT